MTVSLLEVLAAARAHAAPLAAESAGYLLLGVADHVVSAPRVTTAELVELSGDGSVRLRAGPAAEALPAADSAERSVRRLLARALEVSSSVGPALRRAAERREDAGLDALVRELESALIPVNRAAARRALARLHRETERARDAGTLEALLFALAEPEAAELPQSAGAPAALVPTPAPAVAVPAVTQAPVQAPQQPQAPPEARSPKPALAAQVEDFPVELVLAGETSPRAVAAAVALAEEACTKPEPVVLRARERGQSTPRLGTLISAQSGDADWERTDRAPPVGFEVEPELLPETSRLPDVLTAMLELHTGVDADEAPTRLRDVTTALVAQRPAPEPNISAPSAPDAPFTPEDDVGWLVISSLSGVETEVSGVVPEPFDPAVHEALTWNPAPVEVALPSVSPICAGAVSAPMLQPEPSPYVPAVLPVRQSDVSELLQSFHVSGAAEENELRGALKEIAGLEPTPMPLAFVDEG